VTAASDVSDMGLPPCRVRSLLRKRRPSRSRPSRMLIWLFIRAAATDVCLATCLGCGRRPKVSSQATCLDFVEVAIHSYRHGYGAAESDPAFEPIEAELAKQPVITVLAWRQRWRVAAVLIGAPPPLFHRPVSTTYRARCGTFPAARPPRQ
jgi:hypothetical protein